MTESYEFTNDWFAPHKPVWEQLIQQFQPKKALEIGAYEGACTCFMLQQDAPVPLQEVYCVDTWPGGMEHANTDMSEVERRFDRNIKKALATGAQAKVFKLKGFSRDGLLQLLNQGHAGSFDLIYIDGSHQAADVLSDSVLAFMLVRVGGVLIWDDYLWSHEPLGQQDSLNMPKPAIDAFVNLYQRKLSVLVGTPLYQLYAQKIAE